MRKISLFLMGILFLNMPLVYAETAVEYLQDGNDAFHQREFDQAIFDYTKAIDTNPNLAKAYDNRGVAYAQEDSLVRAIDDFTMAIANNMNDADAYNNRGHAYSEQGDFHKAIADYTQAIRINPLYEKAYNNRAMAYYTLKEYAKVWADIHKLQKMGAPVNSDFLVTLKKIAPEAQ